MSKANTEADLKKPKGGIISFFTDERLRIIVSLTFILFAALLLLSFVSHLFSWKADQSFENLNVFSNADIKVENWAGKVGAYFANIFMNKWFGLASFAIPIIAALIGLRMMGVSIPSLQGILMTTIAGTILLSIMLGFTFTHSDYFGSGPGGGHGTYIALWLIALIGKTGTAFLLFIASFSLIIFVSFELFLKLKSLFITPVSLETPPLQTPEPLIEPEDINTADIDLEVVIPVTTPFVGSDDQLQFEVKDTNDDIIVEDTAAETEEPQVNLPDYDPTLDLSKYVFPTPELLDEHTSTDKTVTEEELNANKDKIIKTLGHYNIQIEKIKATIGPTVTLYEIVPAPGVRISKIKNLEDDIALSLAALGIRIIAPIPGKGTIGIEVPNLNPRIVSMKSLITDDKFIKSNFDLPIALGKTIANETFIFDLAKMPHLLVAGATGQGKSVGLNAIITSLLYKKHPSQLKFVLVDPKKVELPLYAKLEKYMLAMLPDAEEPIITDTKKVIHTLHSLTILMEDRYQLLKLAGVRNIKEYNAKFIHRVLNPAKGHTFMPYIVLIIDEFADLIMTAGREVETPLTRLAQLARAVGIHLVIATQRPTTNIITGTIKANFPARIAFKVTSGIDSKTILDTTGANQLIGRGDLLISTGSDVMRLQCAFIDIPELERIMKHISSQQSYTSAYMLPEFIDESINSEVTELDPNKRDELFEDAARLVVQTQQGSTSLIQRKFSIGYNRAGRIIDQLEAAGIVGPFEGSKARQVKFPDEFTLEQHLRQ